MVADNLRNIEAADPILAREARLKLIQAGGPAVNELVEGLANPDPNVRQGSKKALTIDGGEATRSRLIEALGDGRSSVSVGAGDVLLQPEKTMITAEEGKRWAIEADRFARKADATSVKAEAKSDDAVKTADRAEIKANSAVKIAKDALDKAETAAKTAEEAIEASRSASKRLDAMSKKLAETKAELESKLRTEGEARIKWEKARAKAEADVEKIRLAEANRVRLSILRAVKEKAAESKKAADELRSELGKEVAAHSQLTLTVRWMEQRMKEQEKTVAKAEAKAEAKAVEAKTSAEVVETAVSEAKDACDTAGITYIIPPLNNFRRRCR